MWPHPVGLGLVGGDVGGAQSTQVGDRAGLGAGLVLEAEEVGARHRWGQ